LLPQLFLRYVEFSERTGPLKKGVITFLVFCFYFFFFATMLRKYVPRSEFDDKGGSNRKESSAIRQATGKKRLGRRFPWHGSNEKKIKEIGPILIYAKTEE
jgi:hypothetical protein